MSASSVPVFLVNWLNLVIFRQKLTIPYLKLVIVFIQMCHSVVEISHRLIKDDYLFR